LCFFLSRSALSASTFYACGVDSAIVKSLSALGIDQPFPIQSATLPDSIAGRDVLGRGSTGSGKTLAFGLAMLTRLKGTPTQKGKPSGLILVPTRELAMQVNDALAPHAKTVGIHMRVISGGMPYAKQIDSLRRGVHILVATPGRLMDLIAKGEANLSAVSITVLDEADQMADLGFLPVVQEILGMTNPKGQRLLFSATLDGGVDAIVKKHLKNPVEHSTAPATASVTTLEHHVLLVHPLDKELIGAQIASREGRTIFFVKTQRGADRLADAFMAQGVAVGSLHGGKSQAVRNRTLKSFRDGDTMALVATDVAARGIHVDDVSLVVHFDAPADHKDYLHRSGRTARAGAAGVSVLLANPKNQREVARMTEKSGVKATFARMRPSTDALTELTGAQQPSGIPWAPPVVAAERSERPRSSGRRRQAPRRGQGQGQGHGQSSRHSGGRKPARRY
jgi:superfamily II DNA/RNA helicase